MLVFDCQDGVTQKQKLNKGVTPRTKERQTLARHCARQKNGNTDQIKCCCCFYSWMKNFIQRQRPGLH